MSRNSGQISAKIIFKSAKPTKKLNWSKKAKNNSFGLFQKIKKSKRVQKGKNYKFGPKQAKLATLIIICVRLGISRARNKNGTIVLLRKNSIVDTIR